MAVRFGSGTSEYTATTGLPAASVYSLTCWVMIVTDRNTYSTLLSWGKGGGNYIDISSGADGTTIGVYDVATYTSTPLGSTALTVGTWYRMALVVNGTTATFYRADAATAALTVSTASGDFTPQNAPTSLTLADSVNAGNYPLDGRIAAVKVWEAALSQAEIEEELAQYQPVRVANLLHNHPLVNAELVDYSGNARTLTAGSTSPTTEAGPPIRWDGRLARPLVILPPAGGSLLTKSVAGAVAPAGSLLRAAQKTLVGSVTPPGVVSRQPGKGLAGAVAPAGASGRQTGKLLAGSLALSGALTSIRLRVVALAGALAPSGSVARQLVRMVAGGVSPSGAIVRQPGRSLAGSVAPSGALATIRTRLLALAGAIAPSGLLLRRAGKTLSGGAPTAGALAKQTGRRFTGSVAPAGAAAAARSILLALAGAVAPSGALVRRPGKTVGGVVAPSAGITRRAGKALAGAAAPSGVALKLLARLLGGGVAPAGASTHVWQGFVATVRGSMRAAARRGPDQGRASRDGPTMREG